MRIAQRINVSRGVIHAFGYTLICLPIGASFLYVSEFGVNIPTTDTWLMAPLFDKLFSGELSLDDLWKQHPGSEHRPLLPRIFLLLMGPLADFNIVTIMYATQLCLLATFVCIFAAYRETVGVSGKSLFFAVPMSLLVFDFGQYWNMFNAWSIHVVVVNSFAVLSFLLLSKLQGEGQRKTLLLFLASIVSGSAATLSAGHGLLVWPVGLMQLFLEPITAKRKGYSATVWTLIGIVHWTVYFWDYKTPAVKVADRYIFNSSTLGADYFLSLIGFATSTVPRESSLSLEFREVAGAFSSPLF